MLLPAFRFQQQHSVQYHQLCPKLHLRKIHTCTRKERKHQAKPEKVKGTPEMNSTAEAHVPAGMVDINNSARYYSNYYTL